MQQGHAEYAVTPVTEGETTVKVTAGLTGNKYIKSSVTVPVVIKAMNNANLASLSVKNGSSELIDGFDKETTEYTAKTTTDAATIVVTPVCDNSQATAVVKYNGAEVSATDGAATVTLAEGVNDITVEVTAADNTTTKTYTITVDKSYFVAETFNADPGSAWGFTGNGGTAWDSAGELSLIPASAANKDMKDEKALDENVKAAKAVEVSFKWRSKVENTKGRHSNFELQDENGNLIFLLRGDGSSGIYYSTTTVENPGEDGGYQKLEGFSQNWYTVDLTLDFTERTINGTIKNSEGAAVKTFTNDEMTAAATNLGKLYAYNTYGLAPMAIDNFYIKAAE